MKLFSMTEKRITILTNIYVYNKWCISNYSPAPNPFPASCPSSSRERDEFPLSSKLLPQDLIWYRIFFWPVYVSCPSSVPSQLLGLCLAHNYKHQHVISIVFLLEKHSFIQDTLKKTILSHLKVGQTVAKSSILGPNNMPHQVKLDPSILFQQTLKILYLIFSFTPVLGNEKHLLKLLMPSQVGTERCYCIKLNIFLCK